MKSAVFLLAVLFTTLVAAPGGKGEAALSPGRTSLVCEGVTVYYDGKDAAFARKFCERMPELLRQSRDEFGRAANVRTAVSLKTLKSRRDEYLEVVAYYLGLERPTASMRKTFDVVHAALEQRYAEIRRDWGEAGMFDTVQIWRKHDLAAELRERPKNDFYELNTDGFPVASNRFSLGVTVHLNKLKKKTAVEVAPLRIGEGTRKNAFLSVVIDDSGVIDIDQEVARQFALVLGQLKGWVSLVHATLREKPPQFVLHETVEVAIVTSMLKSNDRRWFCEGMANFIAHRALVELVSPEVARRCYNLNDQLVQGKRFEYEVNLPQWKISDELTVEEKSSEIDRARYAYATKAIANVYEKHGREFFPRWCREIARTPRSKANIATVHAAFELLTGEKLEAYYPRPLFAKP